MEKNKTESKVVYDDRRKELTQHFKTTQEIKIKDDVVGESVTDRITIFKEKGIKIILADLADQRTKLERTNKQLKEGLKDVPEMTEDLKELEKNLQAINDFNKNKRATSQIEINDADLEDVKKDIREIKDTVGTRLKL